MENVILGIVVGFVLYWYIWAERFYAELEERGYPHVADAVATKEQENSHETCTGVSSVQDSCNPQHSETVVLYTPDKDGWRVGAYIKDPSMFAHGNNTGK